MRPPLRDMDRFNPRRGAVVPFLLVSLTVFLLLLSLAVNASWIWSVHEDIKTATDAAAFAAGASLADDDMLRGDTSLYPALMGRVANSAIFLANANLVRARPFELRDNLTNDAHGDIVLGVVTLPLARDFVPVPGRDQVSVQQALMNTVVIHGRQTRARHNAPPLVFGVLAGRPYQDVQAVSAVTLDHGVRGFAARFGPIPLAPIALSADGGVQSWPSQVEQGNGPDILTHDSNTNAFGAGPDQIREFPAVYATDASQVANANVAFMLLPSADTSRLASQLDSGITAADLTAYQGKFVLPDTGTKDIAGQQVGPAGGDPVIQGVAAALDRLRASGAVRAWPLYSAYDSMNNVVHISGFVAARVANVTTPAAGQPLSFTLQATMMVAPSAVTDTDLNGAFATRNDNRYLCRLRRIE
ncbi:MAG: pilus assembly protein TadG-related protein [Gemmataceae bacterium]